MQTTVEDAVKQNFGFLAFKPAASISGPGPETKADMLPQVMVMTLRCGCPSAVTRLALTVSSLSSSLICRQHSANEQLSKKKVAKCGKVAEKVGALIAGNEGRAGFGIQYIQVDM